MIITSSSKKTRLFLVPRSAVGTYGLAFVRPCVRPFVRQRSQNLFIGIFYFWHKVGASQCDGSDIFGFCPKNPVWPFFAHFGQKMAIFGQKSTFRPISQNVVIGSSLICIFKLYFWCIYEIT